MLKTIIFKTCEKTDEQKQIDLYQKIIKMISKYYMISIKVDQPTLGRDMEIHAMYCDPSSQTA